MERKMKESEILELVERVLRETGVRQRIEHDKMAQVLDLVRVGAWNLERAWVSDAMACDRDSMSAVADDIIDIVSDARRYGEDSVDPGALCDRDEVIGEVVDRLHKAGLRHWSEQKPEVPT